MASSLAPRIQAFKSDGAIAKGSAVKLGTDEKHVAVGAAATDSLIGLAQSAPAAAEDVTEVAVSGGGKGLAGGTIARGDKLTSNGSGALIATVVASNRIVGHAMEAAVVGDIFSVQIEPGAF